VAAIFQIIQRPSLFGFANSSNPSRMLTFTIDQSELALLRKRMSPANFWRGMDIALTKVGQDMKRDSKAAAPYDTGTLRRSIDMEKGTGYVVVGSAVPYARIHELGGQAGRNKSVTIQARPYLGPALDKQAAGQALKHVAEQLAKLL